MKKIYILFIFSIFIFNTSNAQPAPKREMRGAWIATYANIDWPSSTATSAQEQSTFIQRVDEHKATGMNALFVQVRSQCDALYPNPYDPWSAVLSGTQGVAPSPLYDPLAFMINETKQRGMEFHAWFNPYRALASFTTASYNALAASHVAKAHPTWIMTVTNNSPSTIKQLLLNPGAPEVQEHIISAIMHVVRNYDVDGIHFDDYFYTNPATTTYNDDSVYAIHNRGIANRGDWRRSNVDTLIKRLNDSIHNAKPWIKFGISPSGIWMSQANDASGSNTSAGALQHKKDLYANSRLWLQQGWIDYLAPQVYWYIGQSGSDYNILAPWWNNNGFGRHIYMGQAGYKVGDGTQNAAFATDNTQIPKQMRLNRGLANINGQVVYNTTSLRNNPLGFRDSLRLFFYNKPALQPTMDWRDNIAPDAATLLTAVKLVDNTVRLNWVKPIVAVNEMDKVKRFVIYKTIGTIPTTTNADNLIAITTTDVEEFIDADVLPNTIYNYFVTSVDRLNNESVVSNMATVNTGILPLTLLNFDIERTQKNNVELKWQTANEVNTHSFDVERAINNNGFKKIATLAANDGSSQFDYKTTDYNVIENGTYYYKLKMIDKDGRFTFSDIKKISIAITYTDLIAYPNPIKKGGEVKLIWQGANTKVAYRLINTEGKVLMQNNVLFNTGVAKLTLSNNIMSGIYILQFFKNEELHTIKLVVQ
jgi:uncharacterized lipoprotein YddW (UPF0748 family)